MFHVVTDTDDTAKRLLDIMNREKTGRLTFMPLNRLRPNVPTYPDAQDAIPLIQKLRFNDRDVKAFQQVFGKTCVCRDLTIAAAYVKSHGINTITLDGDKVDRKGALTGGYHDVRRSRIEAIKAVTSWKTKHATDDRRLQEVKRTILTTEQEITRMTGKIQVLSNQQLQARQARDAVAEEMTALGRESERLTERVAKLEGDIVDLETEISSLNARSDSLRAELASPLARGLTGEEERLIEDLGREIEQRQKQLLELGKKKNEVRVSCVYCLDLRLSVFRSSGVVRMPSRSNSTRVCGDAGTSCSARSMLWERLRLAMPLPRRLWRSGNASCDSSTAISRMRRSDPTVMSYLSNDCLKA